MKPCDNLSFSVSLPNMTVIEKNLKEIRATLKKDVKLVAVSKTKPISDLQNAYNAGQRDFGENKIQEMTEKSDQLPMDVRWHMIGHVQTNKVKYMAPYVDTIHAVDSIKLLKEINKQAAKNQRVIKCLLQVKIAEEESKFGLSEEYTSDILHNAILNDLQNIQITGLMGMATFTNNENQVASEFKRISDFFQQQKQKHSQLTTLSIGMSGDYKIAMNHGSTMVRIGSAIFGSRS